VILQWLIMDYCLMMKMTRCVTQIQCYKIEPQIPLKSFLQPHMWTGFAKRNLSYTSNLFQISNNH